MGNLIDPNSDQQIISPENTIYEGEGESPVLESSLNLDESLRLENISQFDVYETAQYSAQSNTLSINSENLMLDVPTSWATSSLELNIPSIFENLEYFEDLGKNGDWTDGTTYWDKKCNYGETGTSTDIWVDFNYDSNDHYGYIDYHAVEGQWLPDNFYGYYYNSETGYNHANDEVELGDLIEGETSAYPISTDFSESPDYALDDDDPYGNDKYWSTVGGSWDQTNQRVVTSIDTSDSWLRGDPSVSLNTYFYVPFEADSITITYRWATINYGYDANDYFSVKSRVNGNYIDGRTDVNGAVYDDANYNSLEYDSRSGDQNTHDYWTRTYNVTNLVGDFGYRTGWHSLDFGCYMSDPNSGGDDVAVLWDSISINATHYDWYESAELSFDYLLHDLTGNNNPEAQQEMTLAVYFSTANNLETATRYSISETSNLVYGDSYDDCTSLTIKFPQQYASCFEVNDFYFFIGLELTSNYDYISMNPTQSFYQRLAIDTFELDIDYQLGTPEELSAAGHTLSGKILPSGSWQEFDSLNTIMEGFSGDIEIEFELSGYSSPNLRYYVQLDAYKLSECLAEATVEINSYSDITSTWTVEYDNTASINQVTDPLIINSKLDSYNILIENLPAYDGLGINSKDWDVSEVLSPDLDDFTSNIQRTSSNNYYQNITIPNIISTNNPNLESGIWQIIASQQNYLLNASIRHEDYTVSERYYQSEEANITHSVRDCESITGNLAISMYNATELTNEFATQYYSFSGSNNNQTQDWIVYDEGVGEYQLMSLWNDTDAEDQTTRLGWYKDTFEMWRHTTHQILSDPDGAEVATGIQAIYQFEFNQTFGDERGIEGASIECYNDETNNLWGTDWGFIWEDIHTLEYDGDGAYTLTIETAGIQIDNYLVSFKISNDYYDVVNRVDSLWLNITGLVEDFKFEIISGLVNESNDLMLTEDNIPFVNDSESCKISFNLTTIGSEGEPVRDVVVRANFNDSDSEMYAIEKYSYTFDDEDKGIYEINLDTTSLHATKQIGYDSEYNNYTLFIFISRIGYNPISKNVSVQINPTPLYISIDDVENVYQGDELTIESALYTNTSGILSNYIDAVLTWTLYNSSGEQASGTLIKGIENFFSSNIQLSDDLIPGDYSIKINATGLDLSLSYSREVNFTIFEKYATKIEFVVPETVRIGGFFSIAAKLMFMNNTAIIGKNILLTINYSEAYSYQVLIETDQAGKAIYELSIPSYYEGNMLSIKAEYSGEGINLACEQSIEQIILGKIPAYVDIIDIPEYVQVGYNASFKMQLNIEEEESTEGKLIYLFAFYDNSPQPFKIQELSTNDEGIASYTFSEIENGHENISVQFEFLGDSRIQYQTNITTVQIYNRWVSGFQYIPLSSEIRLGQIISLNFSLISLNSTFSESFAGEAISFEFDFEHYTQEFVYHADSNGTVYFEFQIPDTGVDNLNIAIEYAGTNKIAPYYFEISKTILDKKPTTITVTSSPDGQLLSGEYFYSLDLKDQDGNPLIGKEIVFRVYDSSDTYTGKSYTAITNDVGFASVSIDLNELGTGNFVIKAEFDGEGVYDLASPIEIEIEVTTYVLLLIDFIPYILGGIAVIICIAIVVRKTVVLPARERRKKALQYMHQRLSDAENIMYILVLNKDGISLFSHSFTNIPIDDTLVSGFLSAISSFGDEIGRDMEKKPSGKGLEQLSYKQFKIVVSDAALCRVALLLMKNSSPTLMSKLQRFTYRFQENYFDRLEKYNGKQFDKGPVLELIEQFLEVDLLYPHNLNISKVAPYKKELDKNSPKRLVLDTAQSAEFNNTFYIRDMLNKLSEQEIKEIESFNAIDTLRKDNVLFAINPRTKSLIEQFRPIIDRLDSISKQILVKIMQGVNNTMKLRKSIGISGNSKSKKKFDDSMDILKEMSLIDNSNKLTEMGEAVATMLNLIQDLA